ncbi:conserved protein of unknown function (plasmid) [Rhodovastum atsumiense]|uniref:DUF4258 domain-containing protein n=1 Tax=Rhodovastum atsumiense TaxID=504468 RepID=A0A5M6IWF2_9PROT|nr:hypothetical protein [Rhodovastum atsumiense]KAA5611788.1 hypothetical protein F1189_12160 [Rhodovastum atsumiense]CAH2606106.1 conserved protein of unknown function [Rhodovastum atsumiense]
MWNECHSPDRQALKLTRHAAVRTQQRSIPQFIHDGLLGWGDRRDAGCGASSYSFSKRGWRKFAEYLGVQAKYFERYRNAYIVVAEDGTIITVCWKQ